MIARDALIAEALTWVGTPFRRNQMCKGVGADCIGVVVGAGLAVGVKLDYYNTYSPVPDGSLRRELLKQFDKVFLRPEAYVAPEPGDILMMSFEAEPHHVALYIGEDIVHAYMAVRRCVRQPYSAAWRSRVMGIFRFRGVA